MKRLKWILLTVVLLIGVVVTVVILKLDAIVRHAIQTQSTSSLGLPTELGSAHVSILGQSLSLKRFEVSSPKGFAASPMFSLDQTSVGVSIGKLRADPVAVDQITIDAPRLVIEHVNGKFNFKALTDLASRKPADNSEPLKLIINDLVVNDAQVVIRPGIPGLDREIVVPIPSFHVKQIGTGKGNQNALAIRQVVLLVVSDLAKKASESPQLPGDVRALLGLNAAQIEQQVRNRIDQEIDKIGDKVAEEADRAIKKGIDDLLGGKGGEDRKR
jgi:hypothetical protein